MKARILTLAMAVLLLAGCTGANADPEFLSTEDFTLQVGGVESFTWDEKTCQTSFNREKKEFRAFTDTMSDYWCITMSEVPSDGTKSLTASLTWTTSSDIATRSGMSFKVVKTDGQGRYWLWCKKEKTGVTVQIYD